MNAHTVTVTALDNTDVDGLPDDQYVDGTVFAVECPASNDCSVWEECGKCTEYEPTEDEDDDGEYTRHDLFHQRIDGYWMTDTGHCAATTTDSGQEAMEEAAREAGLGVHQIKIDYEGDGCWSAARVIPPEEAARMDARASELYAQGPRGGEQPWEDLPQYMRDYYRRIAQE